MRVRRELHSSLAVVNAEQRGIRQLNVDARGQRSRRIGIEIAGIVPGNVSPGGGGRRYGLRHGIVSLRLVGVGPDRAAVTPVDTIGGRLPRETFVGVLSAPVEQIPIPAINYMRPGRQVVFRVAANLLRLGVARISDRVVARAPRVADVKVKIVARPVADRPELIYHRRAGDAVHSATGGMGRRVSAVRL